MESKEVAAAILTNIVFDCNDSLRSRLNGTPQESTIEEVTKVYLDCLKHLKKQTAEVRAVR